LLVRSVATANRLDATSRGAGVGSTARALRRLVAGVRCGPRECVHSTAAGTTSFALARGRVTLVTVAAPARPR
jgi:hypothetical protein